MKTPVFVLCAVFATAVIAESQTPKADEIPLADDDNGKVELTLAEGGDGRLVNIVCEDAPIADILRQFRKIAKANIISCESTNLSKRVSISLYDAPWLDSLKSVLGMGGFALDERNGIYFVTPEHVENPVVRTKSFELNHAGADELVKLLNESFGEKDKKTGKVTVGVASVFKDSNVVVVKGTDKMIRDCEEVIKSVDKAPPQVYIEARFIQLDSEALHKLGIDWSVLENYKVEARNLHAGYEANAATANNFGEMLDQRTAQNQRNVNSTSGTDADGKSTGTSITDQRQTQNQSQYRGLYPDSIGAAERAGASAASMAWREAATFSGELAPADFSLVLSAFEKESDAKVFSNPRIIVSNGKQAKVDMTTKYPNIRVTASRTGSYGGGDLDITAQLEQIPGEEGALFSKDVFFSWGITLEVTPRISPDGLINVEIVPMISSRNLNEGDNGWAQVEGNGTSGAVYSKYPIIDVQRLVTDFTMKDGSTAVIGGLTQTTEDDVDSGIPYLRKIPWIGQRLFGWRGREKVQKEIIVFVTVGIANPHQLKQDVGLPKNAVLGREYLEGKALEPGDRGGRQKAMELDMRNLADRYDEDAEAGTEGKGDVKAETPAEPEEDGPRKSFDAAGGVSADGPKKKFDLDGEPK